MFRMNLRKMVLATAAAAFMVYAPVMAEEDIILEETVGAVEETVPETGADLVEAVAVEAVVETSEVPEEVAQEAEAQETEANASETMAQSFLFENDEVVIKATAAAALPENTQMQVTKLEAGSAEFEAAKAAAANSCGPDDNAEYKFYSIIFVADGAEVQLAEDEMYLQVEFKTIKVDNEARSQSVLHIEETEVTNVTAQSEQGSNMSSVNFAV